MENESKTYKVCILSDTHGYIDEEVLSYCDSCDYILHAGDVTSGLIVDELRKRGKVIIARGNCDDDPWAWNVNYRQLFTIGDVRFCMCHDKYDVGKFYKDADIIVTGHSHVYHEEMKNGRLWLNPGSVGRPRYGDPASLVIMEITGFDYKWERKFLSWYQEQWG